MQYGPGGALAFASRLKAEDSISADCVDRGFYAWNLQEDYCLVARRIVFHPLFFQAQESSAGVELSVVAGLLSRKNESKRPFVESLCRSQILKVQFQADQAGVDVRHGYLGRSEIMRAVPGGDLLCAWKANPALAHWSNEFRPFQGYLSRRA